MNKNLGFRGWFYFRQGWSTYFAFIFAAINTMVVTYYLAIENIPALKEVFPTFYIYFLFMSLIGIPILIAAGYIHFKRTQAFRAEADISWESNPFQLRMFTNSEILVKLNLQLIDKFIKFSQTGQIKEEELREIEKIKEELEKFVNTRSFQNKTDLDFFKKIRRT
ncbi:MAG: hypothetical protein K5782_02560 [Nitrosarchaeum sp.]|nr:hypothetical protein [Nitrosarchaeum sp.]